MVIFFTFCSPLVHLSITFYVCGSFCSVVIELCHYCDTEVTYFFTCSTFSMIFLNFLSLNLLPTTHFSTKFHVPRIFDFAIIKPCHYGDIEKVFFFTAQCLVRYFYIFLPHFLYVITHLSTKFHVPRIFNEPCHYCDIEIVFFYCSTTSLILLKCIPLILYQISHLSTQFYFPRWICLVVIENVTFVT
ncbi:unnamed protein product [Meganyctiphanes norvegica]|uniref:Uncharacterized protein n=1 Tax=Meganyctiphanes norvegica TaxID=48144 RepID=A0AAV2SBK5_MEGNR